MLTRASRPFTQINCSPLRMHSRVCRLESLEQRLAFNGTSIISAGAATDVGPDIVADNAANYEDASSRQNSREELRDWLAAIVDQQFGHLFGTRYNGWSYQPLGSWDLTVDRPVFLNDAIAFSADFDASVLSNTNIQVDGVDEADLVETDGQFIYLVSGKDLVIVAVGEDGEMGVASRLRFEAAPTGMYLHGDRLALLSSTPQGAPANSWNVGVFVGGNAWRPRHVATSTMVTLLDVADRTAPKLVERLQIDGQVRDSRAVDGQLRLVIGNDLQLPQPIRRRIEGVDSSPVVALNPTTRLIYTDSMDATIDVDFSGDVGYAQFLSLRHAQQEEYQYETRDEYLDRVLDEILPQVRRVSLNGSIINEAPLFDAKEIYRTKASKHGTTTTIATIDMHGTATGVIDSQAVVSSGAPQISGTADAVYVFTQEHSGWSSSGIETSVFQFDVNQQSGDVRLAAWGAIAGRVLNQFAVDEHDGYLRVVTQEGTRSGDHRLHVLQQVGRNLKTVGEVGGMAPGEELHSVRFVGERAFVVTFQKVDPLFALDLSDPTNPTVEGELKIPGYSDYLQPIGENHLLGIGRGANEQSGLFEEMQVSIFDVSSLDDPQLVHRHSIGGGRTTASVATGDRWIEGDGDHHAIGYFPSEQIMALPIFNAGHSSWRRFSHIDNTPLFDPGEGGLQVLRVDPATGIEDIALIEHETLIARSLHIGESLYALSPGSITIHSMSNQAVETGRLDVGVTDETEYTQLTVAEYVVFAQYPAESVAQVASAVVHESRGATAVGDPHTTLIDTAARGARASFAPARRMKLDESQSRTNSYDAALELLVEPSAPTVGTTNAANNVDLNLLWPTIADEALAIA